MILLTDAPLFVTRPTNAAGMPGDKLSLMCEVDANPRPSYKWYKVHSETQERSLVGTSGNLTIEVSASTGKNCLFFLKRKPREIIGLCQFVFLYIFKKIM